MPLTNYPQGVSSFGIPLIGSGPILTTGKVLFVNNSHGNASDGNMGEQPDRPLRSLSAALAKCSPNNGDHIVCGPGHVETITSANNVVIDVAGVSLIGLGRGSGRPTFKFTTSIDAEIKIAAANVLMHNFLFTGGIDSLQSPLDLTSAADDAALIDIEYRDVTGEAWNFLNLAPGADRVLVDGFVYRGSNAAGGGRAIQAMAVNHLVLRNFWIDGNFSVGGIVFHNSASANINIHDGYIRNRNTGDICIVDSVTGSTGRIGPNLYLSIADNAANITEAITGATWRLFGPIKVVNLDGEQAMDINTTTSTDA